MFLHGRERRQRVIERREGAAEGWRFALKGRSPDDATTEGAENLQSQVEMSSHVRFVGNVTAGRHV